MDTMRDLVRFTFRGESHMRSRALRRIIIAAMGLGLAASATVAVTPAGADSNAVGPVVHREAVRHPAVPGLPRSTTRFAPGWTTGSTRMKQGAGGSALVNAFATSPEFEGPYRTGRAPLLRLLPPPTGLRGSPILGRSVGGRCERAGGVGGIRQVDRVRQHLRLPRRPPVRGARLPQRPRSGGRRSRTRLLVVTDGGRPWQGRGDARLQRQRREPGRDGPLGQGDHALRRPPRTRSRSVGPRLLERPPPRRWILQGRDRRVPDRRGVPGPDGPHLPPRCNRSPANVCRLPTPAQHWRSRWTITTTPAPRACSTAPTS